MLSCIGKTTLYFSEGLKCCSAHVAKKKFKKKLKS